MARVLHDLGGFRSEDLVVLRNEDTEAVRHALIRILLGAADSDGDRRVSLSEAYAYAYEGTLRASSRSWGGTQHPTYSYDLRGHEDVILTTLSSAPGHLVGFVTLPPGRSFLMLRNDPDGSVVAETTIDAASHRLA